MKAALVGTGWWGKELAKAAPFEFSGFLSNEKSDCEALQDKYGGRVYGSFSDLLGDGGCEAVLLATPHSLHAAQVEAAAAAGKHVFVEKPLALTAETASRAAEACRRHDRVLAVGHNRRFSACAHRIKALLDSGECGRVIQIEANYSGDMASKLPRGHWRLERSESPAAGIAPMGLHMVDTVQWLLGPVARLVSVCKRQALDADLDDTSLTLFELASGVPGTVASHLATPLVADLRIYCTGLNLQARGNFSSLRIGERVEVFEKDDTVAQELRAFAAACAGGRPFPVTPEEAVRNVAVMEAIARSGGQWVAL